MAPPPKTLSVRPPDFIGGWLLDDRRYFENAHVLLGELEAVVVEVNKQWPKPLTETVKRQETTTAHWNLTRRRDLLSDSVKVFTAMSVEAFLNFYGVLRLGQTVFESEFESKRLGPVAKLKKLFALCDNLKLTDTDPVVVTLERIAKRRNRLVHPRVVEVSGYVPGADRGGDRIPEVARESVADMVKFFEECGRLKPELAPHLPPPYKADA